MQNEIQVIAVEKQKHDEKYLWFDGQKKSEFDYC